MLARMVASTMASSHWIHLLRMLLGGVLTLLIAGFLGCALIRFAAGYGFDESTIQPGVSPAAAAAIRNESLKDSNVVLFYGRYLNHAIRGDFGMSPSLNLPVAELIRLRLPVTFRLIGAGLLAGWVFGLALAAVASYLHSQLFSAGAEALSGLALSLPAAVFALLIFLARGPVFLVLALAVFPRVFRYARDLFERSRNAPRVEAARSRGIPEQVIFLRYVMKSAWAPLVALAGVSFSIAFGVLIPVEVVCDIPGVGQLAWTAARSRDLPVLVTLTLMVTFLTVAGNALAEIAGDGVVPESR